MKNHWKKKCVHEIILYKKKRLKSMINHIEESNNRSHYTTYIPYSKAQDVLINDEKISNRLMKSLDTRNVCLLSYGMMKTERQFRC